MLSCIPSTFVSRSAFPFVIEVILQPEDPWEVTGYVHNLVFCYGSMPKEDGTVKFYWGGADTVMCVGTAVLADLVKLCRSHPRPAL